jgi:integrase
MEFTARWLDGLKAAGDKAEEHFDRPDKPGAKSPCVRGLAIRVAPSGRKTWCFHYTFEGKRGRMDFGHYASGGPSDLVLRAARERARAFRQAVDAKPPIDPHSVKADAQAARADELETVNDLIEAYLADLRMKPLDKQLRSLPRVEWMMRSKVGKVIGTERLHGLTRRTLERPVDLLRRPTPRRPGGSHHMAAAVHGRMHLMIEWGSMKGHLGDDPPRLQTERPEVPDEVNPNARPLTPEEIKAFWHGVAGVFPPAYREALSRILKLSLVSGCRIAEAAHMDLADVRDGVWTIPAARAKNAKPHLVPVNADMRAIIGDGETGSPWGLIEGTPVTGSRVSNMFYKRDVPKALGAPDYTAHSMRRTVGTQMDDMGILESTISLCLNHSEGERREDGRKRNKTTRIYIKPSAAVLKARELAKLDLKRDAFDRWAERLREIIA